MSDYFQLQRMPQQGISLIEQVTEVCHMLAAANMQFVVAGGFARDTAAGVQPKDADIMVYDRRGDYTTRYWLPDAVKEWAQANGLPFRDIPSYGEGDSDFDKRVAGVAKVGDVDIIIYRDVNHWSKIVGAFDFNINQFYFPSSVPRYTTSGEHNRGELVLQPYNPSFTRMDAMYAGDTGLDMLHPVRADYSPQREGYILNKYYGGLREGLLEWQREILHANGIVPLNRS